MHSLANLVSCVVTLGLTTATPLDWHQGKNRDPSGCGKTHNPGFNNGTADHSIESGGYTRTYAVNVPENYNENTDKKWPLIIDYHGEPFFG